MTHQKLVLGICTTTQLAADSDPLAQHWLRTARTHLFSRVACGCLFKDIEAAIFRKSFCHFHHRECRIARRPDGVILGLPCPPFSKLRGNRGQQGAMDHPEFYTIHQTLSYLRAVRPHGGIMEEVLGFDDKIADKHFHSTSWCEIKPLSWCRWFVEQLEAMGYWVVVLCLDNLSFYNVPRERFVC